MTSWRGLGFLRSVAKSGYSPPYRMPYIMHNMNPCWSVCASVEHNYIPYSGKFFTSINFCKSPTNAPGKNFTIFISQQDTMSDHTPYNFPHGNVAHIVRFQRQNDSKISTLIKVCQLLLPKRCRAKGRELTLRIYLQLRRVDHRSQKISAVCSMLLRQNASNFCQFTGSASQRHCAQLVSKKCLEENFCRNKLSRAGV